MKTMLLCFCLLEAVSVLGAESNSQPSGPSFDQRYHSILTNSRRQSDSLRLQELFRTHWEYTMQEFPEFATYVGFPGVSHRWTDYSLEAIERRQRELPRPLKVLKSINRSGLKESEQLSFDLFKKDIELELEGARFPAHLLPLNQLSGVQQDVAQMVEIMPRKTARDRSEILSRLEATPRLVEQVIALMEKGLTSGITPPKITLRDVPQQVKNQIFNEAEDSPLFKPFLEPLSGAQNDDQENLKARALETLRGKVFPAFNQLYDFLVHKYIPGCREGIALTELTDGKAWYAHNAHRSTTTILTPPEIHRIGLEEVSRIKKEMIAAMKSAGFKGSFDEFKIFLDTDPRFYFSDAQSLLMAYRDICKRADPELIRLFGKIPRLPYGVLPVPSYAEKSQTTAYYQSGSPAAGRPGYFYANTHNLKTRPKWAMEALSLHEAVPGHHFQIALAQELEEAPEFRKHAGYTAFVEGWGLYSESLGEEMGFYKDPYSKFGQLTYEVWRAIRLVVDTGMHSMGWSRDRAINFFKENTSKSEEEIIVEIDRYIVWPGQALAYKIGELKIKALRAEAAKKLGENFNLRSFHDELLGQGALPLDLLETRMKSWMEKESKKTPQKSQG